jgi:hypothetical protein
MTSKPASAAIAALSLAALSSPAFAARDDACTLLTAAEVGAALGAAAGPGEPILPTDHKVCTWRATNSQSWVTLMLQPPTAFDSGKNMAAFSKNIVVTPVGALGDGAYYLAVGDQVGLIVKKGGVAFKVAVYQHGPINPKQSAERSLAGKIVPRL